MKKGASFDLYDNIPEDMRIYLQNYGFNFSKKMCDFAVSMMKTKEGKITPIPKEKYDELLKLYGIELEKIMVIMGCMFYTWLKQIIGVQ